MPSRPKTSSLDSPLTAGTSSPDGAVGYGTVSSAVSAVNLTDLDTQALDAARDAAVGVDMAGKIASVFPYYLLLVVGLAINLLILVFRSLWVPIKAAVGFVISLGIALGATVAVFQWGWPLGLLGLDATGPVLFILPLLLTGILFGLAMDDEVFLVTQIREAYVRGTPARQAVVLGFQHSAGVVTAAAAIMAGVFAGFTFLAEGQIFKTIGFALLVGVLADAFLVRLTLVPALMSIVGERIWWMPRWLDRVLLNIDIEGEALVQQLDAEEQPHLGTPLGLETPAFVAVEVRKELGDAELHRAVTRFEEPVGLLAGLVQRWPALIKANRRRSWPACWGSIAHPLLRP